MNKFINTDLNDSVLLQKCAIMNILADLENGEEDYYDLGEYASTRLVFECIKSLNWKSKNDRYTFKDDLDANFWETFISTSGKEIVVSGSLFGQNTEIYVR